MSAGHHVPGDPAPTGGCPRLYELAERARLAAASDPARIVELAPQPYPTPADELAYHGWRTPASLRMVKLAALATMAVALEGVSCPDPAVAAIQ